MAMTLANGFLAIAVGNGGTFGKHAILGAETHGPAKIRFFRTLFALSGGIQPFGDQAHHRLRRVLAEFCAMSVGQAGHVPRVFNYSNLHTQADAKVRHLVLTGILNRADLAFHAALTETARHQNRVGIGQRTGAITLDVFGIDVVDIDLGAGLDAGVQQGFDQRLVRVEKLHVLANHGNGHFLLGIHQ